MKPWTIIRFVAITAALAACPVRAMDQAIEDALVELYGKPTLVVRGDLAEMELEPAKGRKRKVYVGRMITYNFGDRTAVFLETQSGAVKVFVVQCKTALDYIQVADLRRVIIAAIGDDSIKTYVTPNQQRFEAVSALYEDEV